MTAMDDVARWTRADRPGSGVRNLLVNLFGWRALLWQSDPPTWDRWKWIAGHLAATPSRLLDAGSGSGGFVIAAASRGHRALGVSFDQSANALAAGRAARLGLPNALFQTFDLRKIATLGPTLGRFDQILCLETVEHVRDDRTLVRNLANLLEPGGTLLLSTPWDRHRPLVGERISLTEDGGHVRWGYSAADLTDLFHQAELDLVQVDLLSGLVSQGLTNLARRFASAVGERAAWALTAPLRPALLLDRWVTGLIGFPWLAIAAVGVKR